jgi:hypothetical protein
MNEQVGIFKIKKGYVVGFKGKNVDLFNDNGKIIRRFTARSEVVNAQITTSNSEPVVAITTKDGKFELYKANGTVIRRS